MINDEKNLTLEELKKLRMKKLFKQYLFVSFGVLLVDLGFYFFLQPADIVIGGMTGLSIILSRYVPDTSWFTPSIFLYFANGVCLILGLIFIGKDFFFKTIYASLLSPTIILLLEKLVAYDIFYKSITENKILICFLCSSLLTGLGVGIAVKNNGSTGGMDVIQKMISKFFKVPMSITMYVTDIIVVFVAGFFFNPFRFNLELTIYGIIGVIGVAYIVDVVALSLKPRRTMYVITKNPERIKQVIFKELDRGVTLSDVQGGYTGDHLTMVICTMDKNESYRMSSIITSVDPKAFTFVTSCKEVKGEYDHRGFFL